MNNIQARKLNQQGLESQLNRLTCIYRNESNYIQIIRISDHTGSFLERAVMSNQCLQFDAQGDALLEVHERSMFSTLHCDTIPCYQLAITAGIDRNQRMFAKETEIDMQHDILAVAA
ncbi:DUF1830 domain-containing protein [Pseudanabaena sp. FACHB-1998]|uniref:DUF1830 domain-containing protein n=1 Tax=Pseudanabaena sp. FACHB-1998 TaxID=2692858 RepID=UPI0016816560|nr:DUF1830 domain-containing protein [Pseudanabaena sp. FACHB-1998]MBD2175797.1 DUF1830 domain-containing protein [Pseudanabaena sp. FACHB-1998]